MSKERVVAGLIDGEDICRLKEAVCVQVEKVYDHCREKDCIEDAEVDFCEDVQCILDKAIKVRVKDAEVVKVLADLDDVPFRRGFFTVNVRYKIKLRVEFCFWDSGIWSHLNLKLDLFGLTRLYSCLARRVRLRSSAQPSRSLKFVLRTQVTGMIVV